MFSSSLFTVVYIIPVYLRWENRETDHEPVAKRLKSVHFETVHQVQKARHSLLLLQQPNQRLAQPSIERVRIQQIIRALQWHTIDLNQQRWGREPLCWTGIRKRRFTLVCSRIFGMKIDRVNSKNLKDDRKNDMNISYDWGLAQKRYL